MGKQWLVLFGLMAVSLTCIFFLGGPGTRRRLAGLKETLVTGGVPIGVKFYPENDKVTVTFSRGTSVPFEYVNTTVKELLTCQTLLQGQYEYFPEGRFFAGHFLPAEGWIARPSASGGTEYYHAETDATQSEKPNKATGPADFLTLLKTSLRRDLNPISAKKVSKLAPGLRSILESLGDDEQKKNE